MLVNELHSEQRPITVSTYIISLTGMETVTIKRRTFDEILANRLILGEEMANGS